MRVYRRVFFALGGLLVLSAAANAQLTQSQALLAEFSGGTYIVDSPYGDIAIRFAPNGTIFGTVQVRF